MKSRNFYSYGKLLITAEYLVLDGAIALAVPVKLGQSLLAEESEIKGLHWIAHQPGGIWFEAKFGLGDFEIIETTQPEIASTLQNLLQATRKLQSSFLINSENFRVSTYLEFNKEWGLGSSSTLIANLARWAGIDPFDLLWSVYKGSGYDIACAGAPGPLLYELSDKQPVIKPVTFAPSFRDSIFFVYLGKKQDSNTGIETYRKNSRLAESYLLQVNSITESMLKAVSIEEFGILMEEHESIVSKIMGLPKLQDKLFKGFPGSVKSLGAWGGDFAMLATDIGESELKKQLKGLGLETFFGFDQLLVQPS
jgi:mevalonate kinase